MSQGYMLLISLLNSLYFTELDIFPVSIQQISSSLYPDYRKSENSRHPWFYSSEYAVYS